MKADRYHTKSKRHIHWPTGRTVVSFPRYMHNAASDAMLILCQIATQMSNSKLNAFHLMLSPVHALKYLSFGGRPRWALEAVDLPCCAYWPCAVSNYPFWEKLWCPISRTRIPRWDSDISLSFRDDHLCGAANVSWFQILSRSCYMGICGPYCDNVGDAYFVVSLWTCMERKGERKTEV